MVQVCERQIVIDSLIEPVKEHKLARVLAKWCGVWQESVADAWHFVFSYSSDSREIPDITLYLYLVLLV